jgi:protein-tyrosine phosphatase
VVKVLFVCTLNKARSVSAERLYRRTPGLSVRSAGIDERAAHQVNENDLVWADRVIVFEGKHEQWLRDTFAGDLPDIIIVSVPDIYNAEDPALVAELVDALTPVLGAPRRTQ